MREALRNYTFPSLVIAGDKDPVINIKYSKEVARLLPHSSFKIFRGAGHQIPLENAKELNTEILTFLSHL